LSSSLSSMRSLTSQCADGTVMKVAFLFVLKLWRS